MLTLKVTNQNGSATVDKNGPSNQHISQPYTKSYRGYCLESAFQPILSISHRRPVGYEGLIRAKREEDGRACSAQEILAIPDTGNQHLELDRLCRQLHMQNFARQHNGDAWLFLNLNLQNLVSEKPNAGFMRKILSMTGLPPRRIVIEILESEITDRQHLKSWIAHFRRLGCLIAIDDFGAGHSNFDRIWELEPDIVKIDRSLIRQSGMSSKIERILSGIVSLIHEVGSLVVIEGIETEREALAAIAANADMVQGFYFSRPEPDIKHEKVFMDDIDHLLQLQQSLRSRNTNELHRHFRKFEQMFQQAMTKFAGTNDFELSTMDLFDESRAVRCYLLDKAGYQIGKSIYSPHFSQRLDIRFTPLLAGDNSNWSHRHYHFRAINQPGKLQVSRPYLSVAGSHMCITVSQAVEINKKLFVFCCDLDWQDEDSG